MRESNYCMFLGITFPRPTAPGPVPIYFLRPPAQITFSRPLTMGLLFDGPQHQKLPFRGP